MQEDLGPALNVCFDDGVYVEFADGWRFEKNGLHGPYSTLERAREKRAEYVAYVITAAGCHHA